MEVLEATPFQQVLDAIDRLSPSDREAVLEIASKRLIEERRAQIGSNARETLQAFREGRAAFGSVDDLRRDLLGEP